MGDFLLPAKNKEDCSEAMKGFLRTLEKLGNCVSILKSALICTSKVISVSHDLKEENRLLLKAHIDAEIKILFPNHQATDYILLPPLDTRVC